MAEAADVRDERIDARVELRAVGGGEREDVAADQTCPAADHLIGGEKHVIATDDRLARRDVADDRDRASRVREGDVTALGDGTEHRQRVLPVRVGDAVAGARHVSGEHLVGEAGVDRLIERGPNEPVGGDGSRANHRARREVERDIRRTRIDGTGPSEVASGEVERDVAVVRGDVRANDEAARLIDREGITRPGDRGHKLVDARVEEGVVERGHGQHVAGDLASRRIERDAALAGVERHVAGAGHDAAIAAEAAGHEVDRDVAVVRGHVCADAEQGIRLGDRERAATAKNVGDERVDIRVEGGGVAGSHVERVADDLAERGGEGDVALAGIQRHVARAGDDVARTGDIADDGRDGDVAVVRGDIRADVDAVDVGHRERLAAARDVCHDRVHVGGKHGVVRRDVEHVAGDLTGDRCEHDVADRSVERHVARAGVDVARTGEGPGHKVQRQVAVVGSDVAANDEAVGLRHGERISGSGDVGHERCHVRAEGGGIGGGHIEHIGRDLAAAGRANTRCVDRDVACRAGAGSDGAADVQAAGGVGEGDVAAVGDDVGDVERARPRRHAQTVASSSDVGRENVARETRGVWCVEGGPIEGVRRHQTSAEDRAAGHVERDIRSARCGDDRAGAGEVAGEQRERHVSLRGDAGRSNGEVVGLDDGEATSRDASQKTIDARVDERRVFGGDVEDVAADLCRHAVQRDAALARVEHEITQAAGVDRAVARQVARRQVQGDRAVGHGHSGRHDVQTDGLIDGERLVDASDRGGEIADVGRQRGGAVTHDGERIAHDRARRRDESSRGAKQDVPCVTATGGIDPASTVDVAGGEVERHVAAVGRDVAQSDRQALRFIDRQAGILTADGRIERGGIRVERRRPVCGHRQPVREHGSSA